MLKENRKYYYEGIDPENIASIFKRSDTGGYDFTSIEDRLLRICKWLSTILNEKNISRPFSGNEREEIGNIQLGYKALIASARRFSTTSENPRMDYEAIDNESKKLYDRFIEISKLPLTNHDSESLQKLDEKYNDLLNSVKEVSGYVENVESISSKMSESNVIEASIDLDKNYSEIEKKYVRMSLFYIVLFATISIFTVWKVSAMYEYLSGNGKDLADNIFWGMILTKATLVAIMAYLISFCAHNSRMANDIVLQYRHRRSIVKAMQHIRLAYSPNSSESDTRRGLLSKSIDAILDPGIYGFAPRAEKTGTIEANFLIEIIKKIIASKT